MPKYLLVVKGVAKATQLQKVLGEDWYVIPAGAAICGYAFHTIILSANWDEGFDGSAEWYRTVVETRLVDRATGVILTM